VLIQQKGVNVMDSFQAEVERIFREKHDFLLRHLRLRLQFPADAEEVLQEACLQVMLHPETAVKNMNAYLWQTAENIAINRGKEYRVRSRLREKYLFQEEKQSELTPERILEAKESVDRIRQKVIRLPEKEKRAFELIVYRGLSYDEASVSMKCVPRQVRRYFARALAQCYRVMQGEKI
jgi:RNA polymerase sigma factor (sigma-70 family)